MAGSFINLDDWAHVLQSTIRKNIFEDFENFNILAEADLQSSICMHLRDYISSLENNNWRVFNQLYQKNVSQDGIIYPDIILTRRRKIKLAIELKQSVGRRNAVSLEELVDDVNKMGGYGSSLNIPTYVIWTVYQNSETEKTNLQHLEKVSSGFKNPPCILIFNLRKLSGHDSWYDLYLDYKKEWNQLYGNSAEN